jgi:glutamate-1-semialdehyde 2,1-aminomutase
MVQPAEPGTSDLAVRARRVIPGGVNSAQRQVPGLEDLVITATSGATFTDDRGRTFTDYHAAFGPPLLGHNDPDVDRAVAEAGARLDNMGVGVSSIEVELAEKLVQHVPSIERVLLTMTGSEATFHAVRLARAVTGRRYLIKFQGCYHGWHDAVAMNVISSADHVAKKDLLSAGIIPEVADATLVVPFNDVDAVQGALEEHGGDVAAIIVEPIPHNIGAVLPAPRFLEHVRDLATRHGTVLIFDEVITGFRHGLGGYQQVAGVTPDLTTLGKAMANGWPISALGGKAELMDQFNTTPGRPAFFAGTFNGHPAMAAAALATINKLETQPVHEHVFRLGERIRAGLREVLPEFGVPTVVSGFGSVFVTYFMDGPVQRYDDLLANDADLFTGYRRAQMADGIFELPLNLKRSHVSYAHTDADVDRLLEATRRALRSVLRQRSRRS